MTDVPTPTPVPDAAGATPAAALAGRRILFVGGGNMASAMIKGLLGAAILGNGELVPILDMPHMLKNIGKRSLLPPPVFEETNELIVMVVDDSPSVRHMTSKVIEAAGWIVETAKDGVEALEKLRTAAKQPAVILSDIEMPRMDGYELLASLRENPKVSDIPVVFITSRSGEKHREKAFESGITEYLAKPYEESDLVNLIRKLANGSVPPAVAGG